MVSGVSVPLTNSTVYVMLARDFVILGQEGGFRQGGLSVPPSLQPINSLNLAILGILNSLRIYCHKYCNLVGP